jgi:hypothetical protein
MQFPTFPNPLILAPKLHGMIQKSFARNTNEEHEMYLKICFWKYCLEHNFKTFVTSISMEVKDYKEK